MRVIHTAREERGQIYVPVINWLMAAATLTAVLTFGSSDKLAGAYGIAVSSLMSITTLLAALVALKWGYNPVAVFAVNGFFLAIDIVFLGANSVKLFEGGWFPLVLAGFVAFLMLTWRKGNILVEEAPRDVAAARGGVHRAAAPQAADHPAGQRGLPVLGHERDSTPPVALRRA